MVSVLHSPVSLLLFYFLQFSLTLFPKSSITNSQLLVVNINRVVNYAIE